MIKTDYLQVKDIVEKNILSKIFGTFNSGVISVFSDQYQAHFGVLLQDDTFLYGKIDENVSFARISNIINEDNIIGLCIRVFTGQTNNNKDIDEIWTASLSYNDELITTLHAAAFSQACFKNPTGNEIFKGFDGSVICSWD